MELLALGSIVGHTLSRCAGFEILVSTVSSFSVNNYVENQVT